MSSIHDCAKAGDSAALNKFFTDLKEGALAFGPYTWPSVVEPPSPPKADGGGGGEGGGNGSRASASAPRAEAELANGQYAQESGDEVEEIVLEDDDE